MFPVGASLRSPTPPRSRWSGSRRALALGCTPEVHSAWTSKPTASSVLCREAPLEIRPLIWAPGPTTPPPKRKHLSQCARAHSHTHTHTHRVGPAPGKCEQTSHRVKQRALQPSKIPESLPLGPHWLSLGTVSHTLQAPQGLSGACLHLPGPGASWDHPSPAHPPRVQADSPEQPLPISGDSPGKIQGAWKKRCSWAGGGFSRPPDSPRSQPQGQGPTASPLFTRVPKGRAPSTARHAGPRAGTGNAGSGPALAAQPGGRAGLTSTDLSVVSRL